MKLIVETCTKNVDFKCDGIILPIDGYSVESNISFSLDEIENISNNTDKLVFVKLNKNLFNNEIDDVKDILIRLNNMNIAGVLFYDLAIIQLKKELNLNIDLVWHQTFMVNNYKTCNYYYNHGVKYAYLGKEITLKEIKEILRLSSITSMVEVVGIPSVGFSRRKLITNYCIDAGISKVNSLKVREKVTDTDYILNESFDGVSFFLDSITNGTGIIRDLYEANCKFIIFKEFGISNFDVLVSDTYDYISNGCSDSNYVSKYKMLGDSTNFFFKETVYRVKKNG